MVLLASYLATLLTLLVFISLSWQGKCFWEKNEGFNDDENDPHIRPQTRCMSHTSGIISNTRWLRLIMFLISAALICTNSLISVVS